MCFIFFSFFLPFTVKKFYQKNCSIFHFSSIEKIRRNGGDAGWDTTTLFFVFVSAAPHSRHTQQRNHLKLSQ